MFHSTLFGNFKCFEKWAGFRLKAAVNQIVNVDICRMTDSVRKMADDTKKIRKEVSQVWQVIIL
ncbi:TPA: hypothetical protein DCG86_07175 [Candidatus Marinimicrobia bacterium]|nr:hypothetical protein [Candidatus Neomarinimicrobiota bacterium]HBY18604.1 hypothetical protein [Candidatus Neomarinimicrobiota bacterium]